VGAAGGDRDDESGARRALAETIVELERREGVVQRLDAELAALLERLRRCADGAPVRTGDARRLLAGEQMRRRLKTAVADLERRRSEAFADAERARQRRLMLEAELAADRTDEGE